MPKKIDLTGHRFGRRVVIREAGRKNGNVAWLCRCDCGNESVVSGDSLRSGRSQSCGCNRVVATQKHGCSREHWYKVYYSMMERCGHWEGGDERHLRHYRDRGIKVCELWQNAPRAFGDWLLAHGWHKGLEIDRIDNDQGYYPDNCRVVTSKENANNRRDTWRLDDGIALAMFCSSIGIETCEGGKVTREYARIQRMWSQEHKIHPELMQALKEDTSKQSRRLEITKLKIRHAELMIAGLKELLASKQTA